MLFWESFLAVAEKVGLLFIFIAIGFVCHRIRFLNKEANKCLADIVMYFVTPCVIVNAFCSTTYAREEMLSILKNVGTVAVIAAVFHVAMILAVCAIFRSKQEDRRRIMRFAVVFSNAGFMALPLAQALIDTPTSHEGSLYAAVYLAVFNIVLWTWGLIDMSGDGKAMNLRKIVLNPGIIGVVVGLFLFTTPLYLTVGDSAGIPLHGIIKDALAGMSALNLPLPMFMVGFYLGEANLKAAFTDAASYFCIALRLVVFPLVALGALYLLGVGGNVLTVAVIGASAPVGATTTIFAAKFNRDTDLSVRLVSLSTMLSMITMPFIIGLTQMIA